MLAAPALENSTSTAFPIVDWTPPATNQAPKARKKSSLRRSRYASYSAAVHRLEQGELFVEPEGNQSLAYRCTKRAMDICGALVLIVCFAPIMLVTLIVLTITTRGKPLFYQERVGYRGRRFKMWKFRTMRLDADKLQHLVKNEKDGPVFKNRRDPRITRLGRILRATSIDETPQIFAVLFGEMSLVGPRPLPVREVANQKGWQRRRVAVMPGLTCLWQVSGRSNIGYIDWVRMDLWYVQNQSLWTDIKLLVKTPLTVITCKGAY